MSNSAPCKDCNQRYVGCHSECSEYLDFKQAIEVRKVQKREELSLHDYKIKRHRPRNSWH